MSLPKIAVIASFAGLVGLSRMPATMGTATLSLALACILAVALVPLARAAVDAIVD